MKVSVLLIVALACTYNSNADQILYLEGVPTAVVKELEKAIAITIMDMFMERWKQNIRAPVLPDLPDPLEVDGAFDFAELGLDDLVSGNVSMSGGVITGLGSVSDDLSVLPLPLPPSINFGLNATEINVEADDYTADVLLNVDIPITGEGALSANVKGVVVKVEVRILVNLITGKIVVIAVAIDLGFESLMVNAENFSFNGTLIDWDEFNANSKEIFDQAWAELKPNVQSLVVELLNDILKDCTLGELVGVSCTGLIPPVTTTTTTEGPNPTPNTSTTVQSTTTTEESNTTPNTTTTVQPTTTTEGSNTTSNTTTTPISTTANPPDATDFATSCRQIGIGLLLLTTFFSTIMYSF